MLISVSIFIAPLHDPITRGALLDKLRNDLSSATSGIAPSSENFLLRLAIRLNDTGAGRLICGVLKATFDVLR